MSGYALSSSSGSAAPRVGLGCMGMSEFYGPRDDEASLAALHAAFDCGYRHFDTADFYGQGHNEELLGRFLAERRAQRDQIFLATKCGLKRTSPTSVEIDSSPEYVRAACESSLRRLGTTHIDLFYLHRRSPNVPIEEVMSEMSALVREGKCRYVGLCEVSEQTLRRAHGVHEVTALQSEFSLWTRDVEAKILPATQELGVALVAYSPIGRGFLSGALTREKTREPGDLRGLLPRFADGNFERNERLLDALRDVAASLGEGVSPSQVALAWLLSRAPNIHVIPGTRRRAHLVSNFNAQTLSLSSAHVEQLSRAFEPELIAGQRYPEALLKTVNT